MFTSLKKAFTGTSSTDEPIVDESSGLSGSSALETAEKNLKRWQLEQGRTEAKVESFTVDLNAARLAYEQATRTSGEHMNEGLDTAEDMAVMTRAGDRVRALEAAVAVAIQNNEAAQTALKDARSLVVDELEMAACARVLSLAPRSEALLLSVEQFTAELALEVEALRDVGGNRYSWVVREAMDHFNLFLEIAKRLPSTKGGDSNAFHKYKNFTECLQNICGYRIRI